MRHFFKGILPFLLLCCTIQASATAGFKRGNPMIGAVKAITFGEDHVLFVADNANYRVVALDLSELSKTFSSDKTYGELGDVEQEIRKLLEAEPESVAVLDMAMNPLNGQVFLAVRYYREGTERYALLSLNSDNTLLPVDFDNALFSDYDITNIPGEDAEFYLGKSRLFTISDIDYMDGELYIAGLSNEAFSSVLRRIEFPFREKAKTTSLRIFHTAHNQFETKAPIYSLEVFKSGNMSYVAGGYLCSPLVLIPHKDLVQGAQLNARTVAEIGQSNVILDVTAFRWKSEQYIALATNNRGVVVFKSAELIRRPGLTVEEGLFTNTEPFVSLPLAGTLRLTELDENTLLVLKRDIPTGRLDLRRFKKAWM